MPVEVEETFNVGKDNFFDSVSPTNSFAVIFEDDLTTGYFYAVDTDQDSEVLDALHIYSVADVIDKDKLSKLQIYWSDDGMIASLVINQYCHAVFDFENKAGYCRNGFPENNSGWTKVKNRNLSDKLLASIFHGASTNDI